MTEAGGHSSSQVEARSVKAAKEAGNWRSEGKEYEVQEGDVMLFRFNN
jgi:hypothetical protein